MFLFLLLAGSSVYACILDVGVDEFSGWALVIKTIVSIIQVALLTLILLQFKRAGAVMFSLMALVSCILKYAKDCFGYDLSAALVAGAYQTTWHEFFSFLSWQVIIGGLLFVSVCYCYIMLLSKKLEIRQRSWIWGIAGVGVLSGYLALLGQLGYRNYTFLESIRTDRVKNDAYYCDNLKLTYDWCWKKEVREHFLSPLYKFDRILGYTRDYFKASHVASSASFPSRICRAQDDLIVVLLIGESLRSDHFSLFGYKRRTTPRLEKVENLYSFPEFYSFYTSTAVSLLGMLTDAEENHSVPTMDSFVTVFKKHGFYNTLITSNFGAMTFFEGSRIAPLFMTSMDAVHDCEYGNKAALDTFRSELAKPERRKMIVLQNGTGHAPYRTEDRYERFLPFNDEATPPFAPEKDLIVNAYDNNILAFDDFLGDVIDLLKERNAVVFFASDHGESLGEGGRWLHGGDTSIDEQRHIPAFIWCSSRYKENNSDFIRNIEYNRKKSLSHDFIYHTMISLGGLESDVQNAKLDLTKPGIKEARRPAETKGVFLSTSGEKSTHDPSQ